MLNVEETVACRVMRAPNSGRDSLAILGVDLSDKPRQGYRFLGAPAIVLPLLRRPVDRVSQVVVIEDADMRGTDGLPAIVPRLLAIFARFLRANLPPAYGQ